MRNRADSPARKLIRLRAGEGRSAGEALRKPSGSEAEIDDLAGRRNVALRDHVRAVWRACLQPVAAGERRVGCEIGRAAAGVRRLHRRGCRQAQRVPDEELQEPGCRWGRGAQSVLPYLTKTLQAKPAHAVEQREAKQRSFHPVLADWPPRGEETLAKPSPRPMP